MHEEPDNMPSPFLHWRVRHPHPRKSWVATTKLYVERVLIRAGKQDVVDTFKQAMPEMHMYLLYDLKLCIVAMTSVAPGNGEETNTSRRGLVHRNAVTCLLEAMGSYVRTPFAF